MNKTERFDTQPFRELLRAIGDEFNHDLKQAQSRKEERWAARSKYLQAMKELKWDFRTALLQYFDILDHPKADKAFDLAWECGHDCGYSEVLNVMYDLVGLIKDDR